MLVYGDSLSSAYGMPESSGWVALLEQRMHAMAADIAGTAGDEKRFGHGSLGDQKAAATADRR